MTANGKAASPRTSPALLCYDGSPCARAAISEAARLLAAKDAVVLNVVASLAPAVFHEGSTAGRTAAGVVHIPGVETARRLVEEGSELARQLGLDARPLVEITPGTPAQRIIAVAEDFDAAVIVVGARGLSPLKSLVLGSVSRDVVAHSRRPILVVRDEGDAARADL
jgi:nucleotide-binding universal stress UspA family protein